MSEDFESKRQNWSPEEVEATIRAYLKMLKSELDGEHYVKSSSNSALREVLNNRSKAAVEKKHQNISAVLTELNLPYIDGYKPLRNVQQMLREMVHETLEVDQSLHESLRTVASSFVTVPTIDDILSCMVTPPHTEKKDYFEVRDPGRADRGRFVDFLDLEARNAALGNAGEEFIINYEIARLSKAGKDLMASQIERVSKTKGDGLGYDILSFEEDGRERLIEVKTTKGGVHMPFYLTANELRVSNREKHRYHLYRVFDFRRTPKFFSLKGAVDSNANLEPNQFIGRVI